MNGGLYSLPLLPAVELDKPAVCATNADKSGLHDGSPQHFIAGPENAIVRALADAATAESLPYNPIVLCGASGVGKTSLAHTLVARRRKALGLASVIATSGADLARALAHAIETDSVDELRTRHHRCDLLLVDDLHRLVSKPAAQQFLLAAFDALRRRGSLVVATLRHLPRRTPGLTPTLASRLSGGLVASLSPPGSLARQQLVRQIAATVNLSLPDEVVQQLAGENNDARHRLTTASHLRHAVLQLALTSHRQVRPSHVARLLSSESTDTKLVVPRVLRLVARHYDVSVGELKGKSRQLGVSNARCMAMYLIRRVTSASYAEIGRYLGGRDHSTVVHACQKMGKLLLQCDATRRLADELAMHIAAEGEGN